MSSFEYLAGRMTLRPIERWPGDLTPDSARRRAPFNSQFTRTMRLLNTELHNLGAQAIVMQIAMREEDFRNDGLPRARAIASHPGVIIAFNPDGIAAQRMQFASDVFDRWHDNLRAIALGLEALRKVDRYGITRGRQQYAGFRALPPGATDNTLGINTLDQAHEVLLELADVENVGHNPSDQALLVHALRKTHPDRGGDAESFRRVMRAKEVLGL